MNRNIAELARTTAAAAIGVLAIGSQACTNGVNRPINSPHQLTDLSPSTPSPTTRPPEEPPVEMPFNKALAIVKHLEMVQKAFSDQGAGYYYLLPPFEPMQLISNSDEGIPLYDIPDKELGEIIGKASPPDGKLSYFFSFFVRSGDQNDNPSTVSIWAAFVFPYGGIRYIKVGSPGAWNFKLESEEGEVNPDDLFAVYFINPTNPPVDSNPTKA